MPSAAFKEIQYDPTKNTLTVTYHGGQKHKYHRVSARTWGEFQNSRSQGKFLNDVIKDAHRGEALK